MSDVAFILTHTVSTWSQTRCLFSPGKVCVATCCCATDCTQSVECKCNMDRILFTVWPNKKLSNPSKNCRPQMWYVTYKITLPVHANNIV